MGMSLFLKLPASALVNLCSIAICCICAAVSASSARLSLSALLSAFVFLFTSLSRIEYLVCSCSFLRCDLASLIFFFVSFLSSVVFYAFVYPFFFPFSVTYSVLLVSDSTWLKLSMFVSCFSCSRPTWKRFFNSSLKTFSVFELFSFAVSNRCCISSPRFVFRSFKDIVATTSSLTMIASYVGRTICFAPFLVYNNMVDLANRPLVGRSPCGFMDISLHK